MSKFLYPHVLRVSCGIPPQEAECQSPRPKPEDQSSKGAKGMPQHPVANFSFFTAVCFTINYIVGAGFLSIPHAFVVSGMVSGPVLCIFFAFLCNITKDYALEALSRLEALTKLKESAAFGARRFKDGDFIITGRRFELADAAERLIGRSAKTVYMILLSLYMYGLLWAYPSVFGRSFAGRIPTPFHDGKLCEDCDAQVRFWILIFGCVVVPMSCIDLEEQVVVQVTMSAVRVIVMLMMVATVFAALSCDEYAFAVSAPEFKHKTFENTGSFFASGLKTIIPTTVYASIFHYSIPMLSQPVKDKSQLPGIFAVGFGFTTFVYVALGVILGMYFGNADPSVTQINLYWNKYLGCRSYDAKASPWAQFAQYIIILFPALDVMSAYPLNAMTLGNNLMVAFMGQNCPPLEKGETWWGMMFGTQSVANARSPSSDDDRYPFPNDGDTSVNDGSQQRLLDADEQSQDVNHLPFSERRRLFRWKLFFRLIASVPSLVGALFKNNLGQILNYTGTVAILIAFLVPPALRYQSICECVKAVKAAGSVSNLVTTTDLDWLKSDSNYTASKPRRWVHFLLPSKMLDDLDEEQRKLIRTPYDSVWSNDIVQHVVTLIGLGVFFYVLVCLAE